MEPFRQRNVQALRHTRLAAAYFAGGLATLLLLGSGCSRAVHASDAPQASAAPQPGGDAQQQARLHFYQTEVQPVLQTTCYRCHAGMNRRGGLDMSTRARLLQGGKDGVVVIPGRPEDSPLVRAINPQLPEDDPMRMPPKGTRLTDAQVAAIRKWVADGAIMDK